MDISNQAGNERQLQLDTQRHEETLAMSAWIAAYEQAIQSQERIAKFISSLAAVGVTVTSGMLVTEHLELGGSGFPFVLFGAAYVISLGIHQNFTDQQRDNANQIATKFNCPVHSKPRLPMLNKSWRYHTYGIIRPPP